MISYICIHMILLNLFHTDWHESYVHKYTVYISLYIDYRCIINMLRPILDGEGWGGSRLKRISDITKYLFRSLSL